MMSKEPSTVHTEDIELDDSGAESIVGGAGSRPQLSHMSITEAEAAGYVPLTCEREGMLMKNKKTGREIFAR
jgi:hypothetical protein